MRIMGSIHIALGYKDYIKDYFINDIHSRRDLNTIPKSYIGTEKTLIQFLITFVDRAFCTRTVLGCSV